MSNRASTPTEPTPAPAAPDRAPTPAPTVAAPARTHTHAITITPPTTTPTSSADQGQRPTTTADRTAKIAASQASRSAARQPDDAEDSDSQAEPKPEARTTPLGQAATETPATPEPSTREKNAARIRESLKAQTAAREAEQAKRAAQTQPAQPPAAQQAMTPDDVLDMLARDERGAIEVLRARGFDQKKITKLLDVLTDAAITGDNRKAVVQAMQAEERAAKAEKRAERVEQYIQHRENESFIDYERRQFVAIAATKDGEEPLYPAASLLSADKLYKFAEFIAAQKQPGTFTLESLMLDVEDELASLAPKPTPTPAIPPAPTTTPAAKPKPSRAALPPDLAGESGKTQPKPRTERERHAAILARQEQRAKARGRQAER